MTVLQAARADGLSHAAHHAAGDAHARARHFSLLMHRAIAARLRAGDKSPVAKARDNLSQWSADRQGEPAPAHAEWMALLDRVSVQELAVLIASDDAEADRLRSSSPFAGVLSQRERIELWREAR